MKNEIYEIVKEDINFLYKIKRKITNNEDIEKIIKQYCENFVKRISYLENKDK
jgi:hypothetical protein